MEWIKIYLIGFTILIFAIFTNFLASQIGLKTWYSFLQELGSGASLTFKDGLWLFVLYPLALGGSAKLGSLLWRFLF